MKMEPVVHFEMSAENKARMRKFYETAFGWETHQLGKDMEEYVMVTTSATDKKRMVKKPGTINGGFYQRTSDPKSKAPSVTIHVDDIKKSMARVEKSGGKVIGTPNMIPGIGTFVTFFDTEGNRVCMMQYLKKQ